MQKRVYGSIPAFLFTLMIIIAGCSAESPGEHHTHATGQDHAATEVHDYEYGGEGHNHEEPDHDGEHDHADDASSAEEHDHDHATEDSEAALHADWEDIMRIETAAAEFRSLRVTLAVPGTIVPHPDRIAQIGTVIDASINRVFANVGDRVERGAVLACLTSPDIGLMRAEYDRAVADLNIRTQAHERSERLFAEDIISERARQEAERDLNVARVTRDYAYQRLRAVGLRDDEIDAHAPCPHEGAGSAVHLHAPIAGLITERHGAVGENVDSSHRLFSIVDLDTVWLKAEVFEKDLTRITVGDRVDIRVAAYDTVFTGTVFDIGNTVAETTKTVSLRAEFDNPGMLLKPGMFASAEVIVGTRDNALVVPREAVLDHDGVRTVFVLEDGDYHRHTVETGIEQDGWIEITGGLASGDIVVTTGNFQLASQAMMSGIDPHAGHNH